MSSLKSLKQDLDPSTPNSMLAIYFISILSSKAGHLLGVVNALNIDKSRNQVNYTFILISTFKELSNQTWNHLKLLAEESKSMPLILFLHIPLFKPKGVCRLESNELKLTSLAMIPQSFLTRRFMCSLYNIQ